MPHGSDSVPEFFSVSRIFTCAVHLGRSNSQRSQQRADEIKRVETLTTLKRNTSAKHALASPALSWVLELLTLRGSKMPFPFLRFDAIAFPASFGLRISRAAWETEWPSVWLGVFLFFIFAVAIFTFSSLGSYDMWFERANLCLWERPSCHHRREVEKVVASLALSNIFSFLIFLSLLVVPLNVVPLIGSDSLIIWVFQIYVPPPSWPHVRSRQSSLVTWFLGSCSLHPKIWEEPFPGWVHEWQGWKITLGDRSFPWEKGDRSACRCRGGARKLTALLAPRLGLPFHCYSVTLSGPSAWLFTLFSCLKIFWAFELF